MMQAHRDVQPNMMKWFVLYQSADALVFFGTCTPYPLIAYLGFILLLLVVVLGLYFLVMKVDKDAEQKDVQNGYKLLTALAMATLSCFALFIQSRLNFLTPFGVSAALMLFQTAALKCMIPAAKNVSAMTKASCGRMLCPPRCTLSSSGPAFFFCARIW